MHRLLAPVASRSQVARLRSKLSASSWTRQATSFQCCIDGLASQSRSCSGQNGLSNSTPHSGTSPSSLLVSSHGFTACGRPQGTKPITPPPLFQCAKIQIEARQYHPPRPGMEYDSAHTNHRTRLSQIFFSVSILEPANL